MDMSTLLELQEEARQIDAKLAALYETDGEIKALYRGASLWYSPVVEKPQVMFLGINPGAGYFNNNGAPCHFFEPLKVMEYVDDAQDYQLKWEWQYVFGPKGLNRLDVLSKSVKTNFCYLATEDEAALKKLFTQIRGKLDIAPYEVFGNWTKQVVSLVHPKILVCEGATALEWLKEWSFKGEYVQDEKTDTFAKGHIGDITVLQFSRSYSTFKNIENVVAQLSKALD